MLCAISKYSLLRGVWELAELTAALFPFSQKPPAFLTLLLLLTLAKDTLVLPSSRASLQASFTSGAPTIWHSVSLRALILQQEHHFPPLLSVHFCVAPLTHTYPALQLACLTPFWRQFSSKT